MLIKPNSISIRFFIIYSVGLSDLFHKNFIQKIYNSFLYGFAIWTHEGIQVTKSSNAMIATNISYTLINTWYRIKITRTQSGVITFYIKGGTYGNNWVLVSTTNGAGTNPITDNTYLASNFLVVDIDAGDRFANLIMKPGVDV